MHNNEFEKKLEHKLEELKFTPSEAVWQKVEVQIRKQKRKRRFLYWWLPAAILCIGIAGWFLYTSQKDSEIKTIIAGENRKTDPTSTNNNANQDINLIKEKKVDVTIMNTQPTNQKKNQKNLNHSSVNKTNTGIPVYSTVISKKNNQTINQIEQQKTKDEKTEAPLTNNTTVIITQPVVVNDPFIENKKDTASISFKQEDQTEINETVLKDSSAAVQVQIPILIKDSAAVKKKKMELAFVLKTGVTSISHFSTGRYSADWLYSSPGSSTGGFPARADSSTTKSGIGFSAGIQLKKPVTKRSAFSVGLEYAYYSSSNKIGNTVYSATQFSSNVTTTSVNSYSRVGYSNTYKNDYHFIEVPVLYYLQLNKFDRRPILINGGINYAYLFKSNAQYYYRATGAYYYDQKLFNHSQLQIQTGISMGFGKKLNYPLQIAVHYQYHLSGLWKQKLDLNQHLSFTGIQFIWRMKNK